MGSPLCPSASRTASRQVSCPGITMIRSIGLLIAQALAEGLTLVTHDKRFSDYDVGLMPT
jgi:predicted nucleic acid-binding protein